MMSLQTSKKRNSTIERQYWCVLLERAQGHLVEGLITEYVSAHLYLNLLLSHCWHVYVRRGARLDLEMERMVYLGNHSNAVSAMNFAREQSMSISLPLVVSLIHTGAHWSLDILITDSWDLSLKFWDPRTATGTSNVNTDTTVSTHTLPERVYHLDLINNTLVVGMASHLCHIYDIRKMGEPVQTRESSLKFMTRSLACMVDGKGGFPLFFTLPFSGEWDDWPSWDKGYAIGLVEGRIGVEYFDPSPEVQDQKYAFKCHRQTIDDVNHMWPVNVLAFHPVYVPYLLHHALSMSFTSSCLLIRIHLPDTTPLHQQAEMALSQSGTTKSKSDFANIQNTPVQFPPSRSTATGQDLQWVSAIPGMKGRRARRMQRGRRCGCIGRVMRLRWVNVLCGGSCMELRFGALKPRQG